MAARGFALEWLLAKRIIVAIELNTCYRRAVALIRNLGERDERVNFPGVTPSSRRLKTTATPLSEGLSAGAEQM